MNISYMDLMRPVATVCTMKQKPGTPPWVDDYHMPALNEAYETAKAELDEYISSLRDALAKKRLKR